jgi:Holliday junction resolvase RusA-like endonuclease
MTIQLDIKPLSVNEAWKGRRYKTDKYLDYEKKVILMLPKYEINDFYSIEITYGFSNSLSDIDNPTKMILDILQKKYKVNDRDIVKLVLNKEIVKKGKEFIKIVFN